MCELGVGDNFTTLGTHLVELLTRYMKKHVKKLMGFTMRNIHGATFSIHIFCKHNLCCDNKLLPRYSSVS